jgi:cathepsin D
MRTDFYVSLSVGTPPRNFSVRLDTRTPYLALPDSNCSKCVISATKYSPGASETSSPYPCQGSCNFCSAGNVCQLSPHYLYERTIRGNVYKDDIVIDGLAVQAFFISYFEASQSFEGPEGQGSLGLAYQSLSSANVPTLMARLTDGHVISRDEFSICLGQYGGFLVLGPSSDLFRKGDFIWTPLQQKTNYVIRIASLEVAQYPLPGPSDVFNPTIIDSTMKHVLMLPSAAWDQFYDLFKTRYCLGANVLHGVCNTGSLSIWEGSCFAFTSEQLDRFPTLYVVLEDVNFQAVRLPLTPRDYLVESDPSGFRCLDIVSHNTPSIGGAVLGARWMQKYYTTFDRGNSRIGFAQAVNCTGARYSLTLLAGGDQEGSASSPLSKPFVVQVTFLTDGSPAPGLLVSFSVSQGGGIIREGSVFVTDEDGKAYIYYTLGPLSAVNMVTASLDLALGSPMPIMVYAGQSILSIVAGVLTAILLTLALALLYVLQKRLERDRASSTLHAMPMLSLSDSRKKAWQREDDFQPAEDGIMHFHE